MRPLPVEEEEVRKPDGEIDYLNDELDAIWLIPGTLPEPYWDYTMGYNFNTAIVK